VTVPLYADSAKATAEEMVASVVKAITPKTRVLALTWLHSCTGVKLPVRAVADAVAAANKGREAKDRLIFCLDGVHGLGIDDVTLPSLGCDFFAAGTHKWMFAPRGTGLLWGRSELWDEVVPTIPAFGPWERAATAFSPGGFHSFEYRWAAEEGFKLHLSIGKGRVADRLHDLNEQVREGLSKMKHVELHTPMSRELSAGITCFDVKGKKPTEVIEHLGERGIVGSVSPYTPSCARLAASLWNTPAEVERALKAVGEMA
jgi:selenocysteine lyase/cysteine desulfurase